MVAFAGDYFLFFNSSLVKISLQSILISAKGQERKWIGIFLLFFEGVLNEDKCCATQLL